MTKDTTFTQVPLRLETNMKVRLRDLLSIKQNAIRSGGPFITSTLVLYARDINCTEEASDQLEEHELSFIENELADKFADSEMRVSLQEVRESQTHHLPSHRKCFIRWHIVIRVT